MATHRVHAIAVVGVAANHLVWGVIDSLDLVRALRDPDPTRFIDRERPVGIVSTLDIAGAAAWERK